MLFALFHFGRQFDSSNPPLPYAVLFPTFGFLTVLLWFGWLAHSKERIMENELLVQHAYYDALTKLPNRLLLYDRLMILLAGIHRSRGFLAVHMMDLDGFKQTNDTLGHQAGDELLAQVADRIRKACRETDTVARLGGDEFVILQPVDAEKQASILGNRIITAVRQPYTLSKGVVEIGCSIGTTCTDSPDISLDEVIGQADHALYQSKSAGGNTLTVFSHFPDTAIRREPYRMATPLRSLSASAKSATGSSYR